MRARVKGLSEELCDYNVLVTKLRSWKLACHLFSGYMNFSLYMFFRKREPGK